MFFNLIHEYVVLNMLIRALCLLNCRLIKHLIYPVFKCVETQDGIVANVVHEIGILVRVSCVCESNSRCICTLQILHIFQCVEITFGL